MNKGGSFLSTVNIDSGADNEIDVLVRWERQLDDICGWPFELLYPCVLIWSCDRRNVQRPWVLRSLVAVQYTRHHFAIR